MYKININTMNILEIFKSPLYMAIIVYIFTVVAIIYIKPKIFFHDNGNLKETGCGENKIIFSFPMFLVIFSIIIYFVLKILNKQ